MGGGGERKPEENMTDAEMGMTAKAYFTYSL